MIKNKQIIKTRYGISLTADDVKALKRLMKQIGTKSLTAGIRFAIHYTSPKQPNLDLMRGVSTNHGADHNI